MRDRLLSRVRARYVPDEPGSSRASRIASRTRRQTCRPADEQVTAKLLAHSQADSPRSLTWVWQLSERRAGTGPAHLLWQVITEAPAGGLFQQAA